MYDSLARISRLTRGRFPFYKLTEYLRHKANPHYAGQTKTMWYEGYQIRIEPSKYIGGKLWWAYGRELPIMKWAHQNSKPGSFVDVGACVGEWTFYMARRDRFVAAFEPVLRHPNVDNNILWVPMGLGAIAENVDLVYTTDNEGATKTKPGTTTPIRPLDGVWNKAIPPITLIKIDVEGMERDVIEGARETINYYHPTIIVEDNKNGAIELLESWGYVVKVRMGQNVGLLHEL